LILFIICLMVLVLIETKPSGSNVSTFDVALETAENFGVMYKLHRSWICLITRWVSQVNNSSTVCDPDRGTVIYCVRSHLVFPLWLFHDMKRSMIVWIIRVIMSKLKDLAVNQGIENLAQDLAYPTRA